MNFMVPSVGCSMAVFDEEANPSQLPVICIPPGSDVTCRTSARVNRPSCSYMEMCFLLSPGVLLVITSREAPPSDLCMDNGYVSVPFLLLLY